MDIHCEQILSEYRDNLDTYRRLGEIVPRLLRHLIEDNDIIVDNVVARVKEENSLRGKLKLKGEKYRSIKDITDIVGARVITFYNDDVDLIAAKVEETFEIDWENSVDKRKMHDPHHFGYMSKHYICRIPKELYREANFPGLNEIRFEIQLRTALQHVWASIEHEIGYKTQIEVPSRFVRSLSRLSSLLELADDEFMRIRDKVEEHRLNVHSLIDRKEYAEVKLDGDSFNYYITSNPFGSLNERISKINNAEISTSGTQSKYYEILKNFGFETLKDIEEMKEKYSEQAYRLAYLQMNGKDLDIFSSSLALKNLCAVYIAENGGGENELCAFLKQLNGNKSNTLNSAKRLLQQIEKIKDAN